MCLLYCRFFSVPWFHAGICRIYVVYNKYFQNCIKWQNYGLLINNTIVYVTLYSSCKALDSDHHLHCTLEEPELNWSPEIIECAIKESEMAMGLSLLLRKPQRAELGHLSRDQACPGLAWSGMGADDWPVGLCIHMTPPLVA